MEQSKEKEIKKNFKFDQYILSNLKESYRWANPELINRNREEKGKEQLTEEEYLNCENIYNDYKMKYNQYTKYMQGKYGNLGNAYQKYIID